MIYTVDKNHKYTNGERASKQIFVHVVKCIKYDLDKGYCLNSNLCGHHMLFLVVSGNLRFDSQIINHGNIIYISKFASYTFTLDKPACVIEIAFEYSDNIPLFDYPFRIMESSLDLQNYAEKIYSAKFYIDLLPGLREGLLINLLNALNVSCNTYANELNIYKRCYEWIEQNANMHITAQDVAAAMNYTVAHLNRIIKKHSGKCLSTLINQKKISEIKHLITTSNCSTNDIAQRLHFESPELLRKYFKYHTGISIKEFRTQFL